MKSIALCFFLLFLFHKNNCYGQDSTETIDSNIYEFGYEKRAIGVLQDTLQAKIINSYQADTSCENFGVKSLSIVKLLNGDTLSVFDNGTHSLYLPGQIVRIAPLQKFNLADLNTFILIKNKETGECEFLSGFRNIRTVVGHIILE